jgi:hypothetical protein
MPTPVGPAPYDPDDPDFWDWGEDEEGDFRPRHRLLRTIVVGLVVVGLVLLLFVSVL